MPKIKVEKIISFSTEDPVYTASNLLSTDPAKKWKCKTPGERSASVVLQLEKACVVSSIDIGNEHSAYIEVLGGRSSSTDDFKVLVVMSSFMTPLDSRQSQNVNQVRMFSNDQLSKPESLQKWDRIKIICTQPFNKHVQYGLSFITFYSNEDVVQSTVGTNKIGNFLIRPESPDNLSIGSLFARRKDNYQPLKGAAAIREASSNPPLTNHCKSPLVKNLPKTSKTNSDDSNDATYSKVRNRNDILYVAEDDESNDKIDKIMEKKKLEDDKKKIEEEKRRLEEDKRKEEKKVRDEERRAKEEERRRDKDKARRDKSPKTPMKNNDSPGGKKDLANKRKHSVTKRDRSESPGNTPSTSKRLRKAMYKPYSKLLEGVVLVISGIQNPERANLRSTALSMGAKYKSDWDNFCTHLIAAYRNTPKCLQVKGKGKIVTKNWVTDCSNQRKRLPWRRYALDPNDQQKDESEEEVLEENPEVNNDTDTVNCDNSGDDTEDEIERIQAQALIAKNQIKDESPVRDLTKNDSVVEDVETPNLPVLSDFFKNLKFFVDKLNLSEEDIKQINKYIIAYKGKIIDNLEDGFNIIVITNSEGAPEYLQQCTQTSCVSVDWVWECHNKQKLMSSDNFNFT